MTKKLWWFKSYNAITTWHCVKYVQLLIAIEFTKGGYRMKFIDLIEKLNDVQKKRLLKNNVDYQLYYHSRHQAFLKKNHKGI